MNMRFYFTLATTMFFGLSVFGPLKNSVAALLLSSLFEQTVNTSPGEELTMDIQSGGAIHVHGWDRNSVLVRAHLVGSDQSKIILEPMAGGVLLRSPQTSGGTANHQFEVWVPRKYNLSINSAGGELLISDLEGTVRGATHGGRIFIERSRGHAELFTGGGEVRVADSDLSGSVTTAKGPAVVSNVTGGVRVVSQAKILH